jgi:hypothetical protein
LVGTSFEKELVGDLDIGEMIFNYILGKEIHM